MDEKEICIVCDGDKIERCNNPDHGFLNTFCIGANESACPCCGHDPYHRVFGGRCEFCDDDGFVIEEKLSEAEKFLNL